MAYSVKSMNTIDVAFPHERGFIDRFQDIYHDELWLICMEEIEAAESGRIYCRHDFTHLMDVARIAYILSVEEALCIQKDVIYAAALLHDIGRSKEYTDGIPHDEAGASIAEEILKRSSYSEKEREAIITAVRDHRGHYVPEEASGLIERLSYVIKRADKESRLCLSCDARDTCKWPNDKKNMNIKY
ncbi:HD domain-containing protein [Mogibacterium diversum]|nr:HD domain-containing protein [Mogibacterium diversum]